MNGRQKITVRTAREIAQKNYATWGQWVIETMEDKDILEDLAGHSTLGSWVRYRKDVYSRIKEIEDTAW